MLAINDLPAPGGPHSSTVRALTSPRTRSTVAAQATTDVTLTGERLYAVDDVSNPRGLAYASIGQMRYGQGPPLVGRSPESA